MLTYDVAAKDRVEMFYGQKNGWRMFDARMLTPEVTAYLNEEKRQIAGYLENSASGLSQFVEIGCGYGRYLHVALKYKVNYRGVELVRWLAELGKARIAACQLPENCSAQIEHLSAEHLHCVLPYSEHDISSKSCVFFPFNCFGNLSDPLRVLSELKGRNTEVIISGFSSSEQTTSARMAYYAKCGCTDLSSQHTEQGVQISSSEFLESLAYQSGALELLLNEFGFRLTKRISHSAIGELFFFTPFHLSPEMSLPAPVANQEQFLLQGFVEEGKNHDLMGHIQSTAWGLGKDAGQLSVNANDVGWREGALAWLISSAARDDAVPLIATGTISQVTLSNQAPGTVSLLINTH